MLLCTFPGSLRRASLRLCFKRRVGVLECQKPLSLLERNTRLVYGRVNFRSYHNVMAHLMF
jgi:hypothetical protein